MTAGGATQGASRSTTAPYVGLSAVAGAYLAWGVLPLYWKVLSRVGAGEILAHRILWTGVVAAILLSVQRRWSEYVRQFATPRRAGFTVLCAALVAANWLTFVWAVNNDRVLDSSLGYYVSPLVAVLLGRLFLDERLRPAQIAAVALAACGVVVLVVRQGMLPWVSLVLAVTFALYAMMRKISHAESLPGTAGEVTVLALPALAFVLSGCEGVGGEFANSDARTALFLAGAGVVTALPLMSFAYGARRIDLSVVGLLQYIGPSCMFLLGVLVFGEELEPVRLITFALIWAGLVLYTYDSLRWRRSDARRSTATS